MACTGGSVSSTHDSIPTADASIGSGFKAFYPKHQGKNLGISTWTPGQWKMGCGTVWGWLSYDPKLNLVDYGCCSELRGPRQQRSKHR